jgi:drug/metabolite transporter (DMT)-like permease
MIKNKRELFFLIILPIVWLFVSFLMSKIRPNALYYETMFIFSIMPIMYYIYYLVIKRKDIKWIKTVILMIMLSSIISFGYYFKSNYECVKPTFNPSLFHYRNHIELYEKLTLKIIFREISGIPYCKGIWSEKS